MEMEITFPGGLRVDAQALGHHIRTDQSVLAGGDGSAPEPFLLFLASIGTCAGIYVLSFCRSRNIPTEDLKIVQRIKRNEMTRLVEEVELEIQVPPGFPEKYREAIIKTANLCAVKKHLEHPPRFRTYTTFGQTNDTQRATA